VISAACPARAATGGLSVCPRAGVAVGEDGAVLVVAGTSLSPALPETTALPGGRLACGRSLAAGTVAAALVGRSLPMPEGTPAARCEVGKAPCGEGGAGGEGAPDGVTRGAAAVGPSATAGSDDDDADDEGPAVSSCSSPGARGAQREGGQGDKRSAQSDKRECAERCPYKQGGVKIGSRGWYPAHRGLLVAEARARTASVSARTASARAGSLATRAGVRPSTRRSGGTSQGGAGGGPALLVGRSRRSLGRDPGSARHPKSKRSNSHGDSRGMCAGIGPDHHRNPACSTAPSGSREGTRRLGNPEGRVALLCFTELLRPSLQLRQRPAVARFPTGIPLPPPTHFLRRWASDPCPNGPRPNKTACYSRIWSRLDPVACLDDSGGTGPRAQEPRMPGFRY